MSCAVLFVELVAVSGTVRVFGSGAGWVPELVSVSAAVSVVE